MAVSIKITELINGEITGESKIYQFADSEVPNASWGLNVKRFKFEEPDGDGSSNLSINLGTEKTITFPFKLLNTDDDASDGTNDSEVKTIPEKTDYLVGVKETDGVTFSTEPFLKSGINDFYMVDMTTHTGSWLNNKVQLDGITFDPQNNNPNSLTGSMRFTIGGGRQ